MKEENSKIQLTNPIVLFCSKFLGICIDINLINSDTTAPWEPWSSQEF